VKRQDPKGYYKVLGVPPTASEEAIKRAFRTVAKEVHPDRNANATAAAEFKRLVEAYSVLSDARNRAVYDGRRYEGPDERASARPREKPQAEAHTHAGPRAAGEAEPVQCDGCHRATAQPRHSTFWTVFSVGVTWRKRTEGVYCAACAGKVSLRCSAITAAFGWWGVLGMFWTPISILRNARGGERQLEADAGLLWHNARAFYAQGKLNVAHALARQVAASKSANALDAADFLAELHRAGVPRDTPPLVDPWRTRSAGFAVQMALGLAAPVLSAAAIAVYGLPTGAIATTAYASALAPVVPGPPPHIAGRELLAAVTPRAARGEEILRAVLPQRLTTCPKTLDDGQIIEGRLGDERAGHRVEVSNGADGPAIVKLRDATTDRVRIAFFVGKGGHASIGPLPDGAYHIQYAVGPALADDCRTLVSIDHAEEFPDTETFRKQLRDGGVVTQSLSYVLAAATNSSGAVRTQAINAAKFLSD
jgi:hypothetical protein